MDMISLQGKTNFFERRVGDYQKAGVKMADDGEKANKAFCCDDEDFWKVFRLLEYYSFVFKFKNLTDTNTEYTLIARQFIENSFFLIEHILLTNKYTK